MEEEYCGRKLSAVLQYIHSWAIACMKMFAAKPKRRMFQDLMKGLDEVEAYLAGERAAYKVHIPDEIEVKETGKG